MAVSALFKASGRTLMTTAVITAAGFVTSVISARILGPEGRGLLSGALLIATLAGNASLFGLANSFIYHKGAGRPFAYGRLLALSLLFIGILSTLLGLLGMQITENATLHAQLPLVLMLAVAFAGQGFFYALSQLHDRLRFFNILRLLLVLGNLTLLLGLIVMLDHIEFQYILMTQLVVSAALTVLGIAWAFRHSVWRLPDPLNPPATWRNVLSYGAGHHGSVLLGLFLINFDKFALLHIGTMTQYGFYAMAFTASRLIGALQEAVSTALYSRFAGKDVGELSHYVRGAFRVTFLPMLLLAAIGAALSPWMIVRVYGPSFASMALPFSILLFECVINGASWTLAQRFNAGGRPGLIFVRQFISVLPIFAAIPFLPQENMHVSLSLLMLVGAVLRLGVTLGLYPYVLKERMPQILPTASDCAAAFRLVSRRSFQV